MTTDLRSARDEHLHEHIDAIYDELTDGLRRDPAGHRPRRTRRPSAIPDLVPTRDEIDAERELPPEARRPGLEIDQGVFVARRAGRPRSRPPPACTRCRSRGPRRWRTSTRSGARAASTSARSSSSAMGAIGHVTIQNHAFLNAEDDVSTAAFEIAVDLVLLDDAIDVGVRARRAGDAPEVRRSAHLRRRASTSRTCTTGRSRWSSS